MNIIKYISAVTACAIAAPAAGITAFAEGSAIEVAPQYAEFNQNDVNGGAKVILSEEMSAQVTITLTSPEETDVIYYNSQISSADGSEYFFAMEGYDPLFDVDGNVVDGRLYTVTIDASYDADDIKLAQFTDTDVIIQDGDDNIGSETVYSYELVLVETEEEPEESYTVETTEEEADGVTYISKVITYYLYESYLLGDVNEDGFIDSSDASAVLAEYARTATGNAATFTINQQKAADVNEDSFVDSVDASKILKYYADAATGNVPSWD